MSFAKRGTLEFKTGQDGTALAMRSLGPAFAQRVRLSCETLREHYYEKASKIIGELNVNFSNYIYVLLFKFNLLPSKFFNVNSYLYVYAYITVGAFQSV